MYDNRTRIQASKHGISIAVALVLYVVVVMMVVILSGSGPNAHLGNDLLRSAEES